MSVQITAILATNSKRLIGLTNGKLAWHCKDDMEFFKKTTMGHVLIMGRKTLESLPSKKLPGRTIVALSGTLLEPAETEDVVWARNPVEALARAKELAVAKKCDIFIAGGAQIYHMFWRHCHRFLLTRTSRPEPHVAEDEKVRLLPMTNGLWEEIFYHSQIQKVLNAHAAVYEYIPTRD